MRELRERLESSLFTLELGLGLLVFLPLAALLLAESTHLPTGRLFTDMGLWTLALLLLAWLLVRLARHLRRRFVGEVAPTEPVTRQDLLGYAVSVLIGPMLLVWFVPRLLELHPESISELFHELRLRWVDGFLIVIGLWLCLRPLLAFFNYITRR